MSEFLTLVHVSSKRKGYLFESTQNKQYGTKITCTEVRKEGQKKGGGGKDKKIMVVEFL